MSIVVLAPRGINAKDMFANTNINFVDLILWNKDIKCNKCEGLNQIKVTNSNQQNPSTKMMQSTMIKSRRCISYQNSKKQQIYNIIYTHDFNSNLNIIYSYNYSFYITTLQTILRSNNVSHERKLKVSELMSRITNINIDYI